MCDGVIGEQPTQASRRWPASNALKRCHVSKRTLKPGDLIGKLRAVGPVSTRKNSRWLFECTECWSQVERHACAVGDGTRTSCCGYLGPPRVEVGVKYGALTCTSTQPATFSCECGAVVQRSPKYVLRYDNPRCSLSCPALVKNHVPIGGRVGRLVLVRGGDRRGRWWRCDCGDEVQRHARDVLAMGERARCSVRCSLFKPKRVVVPRVSAEENAANLRSLLMSEVNAGRRVVDVTVDASGTPLVVECVECSGRRRCSVSAFEAGLDAVCRCRVDRTQPRPKLWAHSSGPALGTPTHTSWRKMHERCSDPRHKSFPRCGGAGIEVCARWSGADGYQHFRDDLGERPSGTTLGRIDPLGHYEPGNCRWMTPKEQARLQRRREAVARGLSAGARQTAGGVVASRRVG